ncbi:MAG TPA: transposase, partial [Polyangiaceae bacterium]|nr:transposase [Polyangiaceae bacterium]
MTVAESELPKTREQKLEALVRRMQGELAATTDKLTATTAKLASITSERDSLRKAYRQLMEQFALLKRRIFIAKAERVDATQLELEFEKTKKKLDALAQQLGGNAAMPDATPCGDQPDAPGSRPSGKPPSKAKTSGKGRRNLAGRDDLPQRRIEIRDADLEKNGGTFIGWELSYKLGYQRPEAVRVVLARAKYKTPSADGESKPLPDDATMVEQDGKR